MPFSGLLVLTVVYVFCGLKRRSDLYACLEAMQQRYSFLLVMREFDLVRGDDILDDISFEELLETIDAQTYDVGLVTPPCDTHSRARNAWRSSPGPRHTRF